MATATDEEGMLKMMTMTMTRKDDAASSFCVRICCQNANGTEKNRNIIIIISSF